MYPGHPPEYVRLPADEEGIHFGLFNDQGSLVSVVSVFQHLNDFQFRKFATATAEQGKGFGSKLLNHVIGYCRENGAQRLWCNARETALPFYQRFDFSSTGESYETAGIRFVIMEKLFNS